MHKNITEKCNLGNIEKAFSEHLNKPVWVASNIEKGKLPINPRTGSNAKINDPKTWGTFDEVISYIKNKPHCLPAIAISENLGITSLDLDTVRDPADGSLLKEAQDIVNSTASYLECSMSGRGLHIFIKGKKSDQSRCKITFKITPEEKKKFSYEKTPKEWKNPEIEVFDKKKFITLTGNVLEDRHILLEEQEAISAICSKHFPVADRDNQYKFERSPVMSDEEVLTLCRKAENADEFNILYDEGKHNGDASAADMALCVRLAFYTQDEDQINRLFRKSKLMRDKWEREDYRKMTLEKAIKYLSETYQGYRQREDMSFSKESTWEKPSKIDEDDNLDIEFPVNEIPQVLKTAIQEVSRANCVDPVMAFLPGIGMTALQIGKKAVVQEKEGLEHHPSLLNIGVLKSGERKSQGYDAMIRDIDRAIEQEETEHNEILAVVKAHNDALHEIETSTKTDLRNNKITREVATQILEQLNKEKKEFPTHPCNFGEDVTPERLFQKIAAHGGAYGVFSSEGRGILKKILKGAKEGDSGEDIYLSGMWGDRIARSRVGNNKGELGGEDLIIRKPALTVCCVVQEDVWEEMSKNNVMRQSGLISRINLVLPKSRMGTRQESPDDIPLNKSLIEPFTKSVLRIRKWKPPQTVVVKLSKEASNRRREFFNSIENELAPNGLYDDVTDIATRAPSLCARLALVYAFLDIASVGEIPAEIPPISEEQWLKAQAAQEYFLAQAIDSQRTHSRTGAGHLLQKTARWLRKQKTKDDLPIHICASQIVKQIRGATDALVSEQIIPTLLKLGWLRLSGTTRKKNPKYEVNPKVLDAIA